MRDLAAVMDTAGSERAVVVGISEGAALAALFAATFPARALGLILCSAFPTGRPDDDGYLGAVRPEKLEGAMEIWENWGSGRSYEMYAPSLSGGALQRYFMGIFERASAGRRMMAGLVDALFAIDIRHVLPLVQVPAIMFHRRGEVAPIESAAKMAELIPNCRLVEFDGDDHVPFAGPSAPQIAEGIDAFISQLAFERIDRSVSTVMFTDIVDSTRKAVELGDKAWLELLDRHDERLRNAFVTYGGVELEETGDGFLARFPGPACAATCGVEAAGAVRDLGVQIRAGLHTGEVEFRDGRVRGLAVHVGARVAASAGPDEVLASAAVKDLSVGSGLRFIPRGTRALKGLPGEWELFAVDPESVRAGDTADPEPWSDRLSVMDRFMMAWASAFPATVRPAMRLAEGKRRR